MNAREPKDPTALLLAWSRGEVARYANTVFADPALVVDPPERVPLRLAVDRCWRQDFGTSRVCSIRSSS